MWVHAYHVILQYEYVECHIPIMETTGRRHCGMQKHYVPYAETSSRLSMACHQIKWDGTLKRTLCAMIYSDCAHTGYFALLSTR